jgi:hypothetical protein
MTSTLSNPYSVNTDALQTVTDGISAVLFGAKTGSRRKRGWSLKALSVDVDVL